MNKDQVSGAIKGAAGAVQKHAGKLLGDREQEAKGVSTQRRARVQTAYANLKAALRNSRHS